MLTTPEMKGKCRYCGRVFTMGNAHLAWFEGSYVKNGCPSCGHRLTMDDVLASTAMPDVSTDYLHLPGDPALLRDFIVRAEADLARPDGLSQTWPAFAADVRRAVELARRALGEGR